MAQVAPDWTKLSGVDREIATVIGRWEDVSDVAAEWGAMSEDEQFYYFIDWPVTEEWTERLLAMEATLSPDDERAIKLRALRALVARNRPTLERLIRGP